MKSLITGDLHMSHNPRDAYRFDFLTWFAELARARKPDRIVIAGDLTEEKDRHPAGLVNKVVDHVHALAKIAPVVVVEGNHDYKDEGQAFFRFLSRIPNTRWINKPTALADGLLCLPHTNNWKRDWGSIDLGAYSRIVCHQTFNGAAVGFGRKLDGIPLDVLPRKSLVLCGDIHVPQQMAPVVYIGAPYHVDFGDNYKSRVIMLDARPSGVCAWSSIDTSTLPQKRAVKIAGSDRKIELGTCNAGDIVEIKVEVDDMNDWQAMRDRIAEHAERKKLRVWAIKPVLLKHVIRRRHKIAESQSDDTIVQTFGKRLGLADNVIATGIALLEAKGS